MCVWVREGERELQRTRGKRTLFSDSCAGVGHFVWFDMDGDGQQDFNEPGIEDVVVTLSTCDETIIGTTVTDASGFYLFGTVAPGCYLLAFSDTPTGLVPTRMNEGPADTDSDVDPSFEIGPVVLNSGVVASDMDAGFVQPTGPCASFPTLVSLTQSLSLSLAQLGKVLTKIASSNWQLCLERCQSKWATRCRGARTGRCSSHTQIVCLSHQSHQHPFKSQWVLRV